DPARTGRPRPRAAGRRADFPGLRGTISAGCLTLPRMPESVPADLLAQGSFDSVAATTDGPPLAFASRAAQGANASHCWDQSAGRPLGGPNPAIPADGPAW